MKAHIPDTLGPGAFFVLLQIIEQIVKRHDLFLVSDLSNQQEAPNPLMMLQKLGMQMGKEAAEDWQRGTEDEASQFSEDQMPHSDEGRLHVMIFPCVIGFSIIYRWNYIHPSLARHPEQVGSYEISLVYNPSLDEAGYGTKQFRGDLRDAALLASFIEWLCRFCHSARMKAQVVSGHLDMHLEHSERLAKAYYETITGQGTDDV